MDFRTYQERAARTDRNPDRSEKGMMIPLLGLSGEAGQVLTEYKKYLRDGESHVLFKERFAEELGDLLWYLANTATKFDLDLAQVAEQNLVKCEERWGPLSTRPPFDAEFPEGQRFPRRFLVDFATFHDEKENPRVRVMCKGKPFGDELTDNSYTKDGYGYHDAIHLSFAAVLGWSASATAAGSPRPALSRSGISSRRFRPGVENGRQGRNAAGKASDGEGQSQGQPGRP